MDSSALDHSQADTDALASAVGAAAQQLGLDTDSHHFHHQLTQPDFSHSHKGDEHNHLDVHGLDMSVVDDDDGLHTGEEDLDFTGMGTPDTPQRTSSFGRPPSIRKACDLCHAAKQKCSGDRPSCTRCSAGGWQCNYAPRQRRRTVPKEQKLVQSVISDHRNNQNLASLSAPSMNVNKKRKIGSRDSEGFGEGGMDMKLAMGMAMDMGLAGEEDGEELLTMNDDAMLESIAIDGYLADLPLATFVHNLPYTAGPTHQDQSQFNADDFPSGNDNTFPSAADMDQHTTSALRDAIFSLNESNAAHGGGGEGGDGGDGTGEGGGDGESGIDPHLALLDLSSALPGEGGNEHHDHIHLPSFGCPHVPLVPHILALLGQHTLEPKPGSNTPLSLGVFAPLSRSLRLFNSLTTCPVCSTSPQQTLPQLALLSRTTTILTFPFPGISSSAVSTSAQISVHGARLAGTGLSEAIEQHIVGVVWDSWRAAIREIFASFERKAQEVIQQSAQQAAADGQPSGSTAETQRAGLMFQAMSRLVTAMDEVEGN
ncbi:hypothetical protein BCR39DRAFT_535565 [Naematelia encephala]|uniref:Zn(2)-C6 fungal-type domain-containing protein n=1 Tax=Naematelia encephala TaxID=71784 RepID=A0A1Y2AZX2_9TREE|nr:hypothetical protein BCR39DRAFT_535565 [Naematelia encephala]